MLEREFVIAAFGDRSRQVSRLVKNIRTYSDLPINIITTEDSNIGIPVNTESEYDYGVTVELVERIWPKGTFLEGRRNSNYYKIDFAIKNHYKSLCLLDDDMYIVSPKFIDGFTMADKFGLVLPINPRVYNYFNMMGSDIRRKDFDDVKEIPNMIPAVNFSPFFIYPHHGLTTIFLSELRKELKNSVCRVTVAIIKAMWNTGITPVILPEQWCVCCENAEHLKNYLIQLRGKQFQVPNIMLHLGHEVVREVYNVE